jgi:hypothetical protein
MANVPNTSTYCLTNVTAVVGGTTLSQAFTNATDSKFCSAYKGSKDRQSNFRGYCGGDVNLTQISTTGCGAATACANISVSVTPAMVAGECFTLCVGGNISTTGQGASSCGCMQVICNGTSIYCCTAPANSCIPSMCKCLQVNYGNTVCIIIYAVTTSTLCSGYAAVLTYITATNIKGGFSNGSTCTNCQMYTG